MHKIVLLNASCADQTVDVKLCAFTAAQMQDAKTVFYSMMEE